APAACPRARRREGRAAGQPPRRRSSGGRRLIREEREQAAERVPELAALDDEVELAVLEEELGTLEAVGQRLADRLGDHAWAGEADERARPSPCCRRDTRTRRRPPRPKSRPPGRRR